MKALILAVALGLLPSLAQAQPKSGEQVYKEVCFACHATKVEKAPPRGGKPDLELEEFARAVAYMSREAGGTWQDPDAAMLAKIRTEEKKRVAQMKGKR